MTRGDSSYSQEIADAICERMSNGETLSAICRDESMPARTTVTGWVRANKEFAEKYRQARALLLDLWADEIIDISDDTVGDVVEGEGGGGKVEKQLAHQNVNRARLQVDSRKWLLSKLRPDQFGERSTIAVQATAVPEEEPVSKSLAWLEGLLSEGSTGPSSLPPAARGLLIDGSGE